MDNKFSVAPGDFGQIQPVSAWRAGWLYQGEAVISERWSTDFSAPLTGSATFRVVLLTTPVAVDAAGLEDHRIGVWIAGQGVEHPGRDRQAAAQGVREQAAIYRTSRSAQMDDLTRALDRRSAADDEQFATRLKFAMVDAQLVTRGASVEAEISAVFESDSPTDWFAATGAALLNASYPGSRAAVVDRLTFDDVREKVAPWLTGRSGSAPMPPEALAAGLRQDGQPVEDLIFKLYESDSVAGDEVHRFLVHELGYPEYIAAVHLLAAVANTGAEIVWQDVPDAPNRMPRLSRFNVDEFEIAQFEFGNVREITARAGSEWDSALPFIRAVMPDAMPESHTPVAVQSAELQSELQRLAARAVMADALVARLAQSLQRPSPVIGLEQLGLLDVLNSSDWRSFFELASTRFGVASELRELIELYGRFRTLSVNTSEIEHAWRYLHVADSNEESESRRLPARTLMTRFELHDLIAVPALWPVVFDEFRRWKSGHTADYREAHEATRIDALSAAQLIERGARLAVATNRLRTLPELPSQGAAAALDDWDALAGGITACTRGMNEVDLDSEPYCAECETGFSEPDRTEQISASISALETILSRINGHISAAAVNEILSDQESPEMVKLLKLGEASNINIDRAAAESGTTAFVGEYLSQRTDA